MENGDRIRVLRGEHAGRCGVIDDRSEMRRALVLMGQPAERLLLQIQIPPGQATVLLDGEDGQTDGQGGRGDRYVTLPIDDLQAE